MTLTDRERELLETPEDRAYQKYREAIGGDPAPIGLQVPGGYPPGVAEMGGVVAVYEDCVKQGCTWEELLDYQAPEDDAII
ncbi:MAG: hypothetical protein K2O18_13630 [Oscillospiraceae bacterium]|nr:hypothetical protein [Oscillospiraceae bacterium]